MRLGAGRRVGEDLGQPVAARLEPEQAQAEVGGGVPDRVEHRVVVVAHVEHGVAGPGDDLPAAGGQALGEGVAALGHLDGDHAGAAHGRGRRGRADQPTGVDDHHVVADPLELPEQVGGDEHRDAEVGPDPADQAEHLVAAGGVEAIGRLVEQHQLRVVHQRLRELHALPHAGGVAADLAVALLVEPDVPQGVGGPLAGHGRGQPGHAAEVDHQLGGGHVGGEAVVLGHVADPSADLLPGRRDVQAQDLRRAGGRGEQAEQDLDERGLPGAVGADQPRDAGPDRQGQPVERRDRRIALGQRLGRDHGHHRTLADGGSGTVSHVIGAAPLRYGLARQSARGSRRQRRRSASASAVTWPSSARRTSPDRRLLVAGDGDGDLARGASLLDQLTRLPRSVSG